MSRKLTYSEIRSTAEFINSLSYNDREEAEKQARELKTRMILSGNTSSEDISTFNTYCSNSWDWLG